MQANTIDNIALNISENASIIERFAVWANKLDSKRVQILILTFLIQGNIVTPFALWSMHEAIGYNDVQSLVIILGGFAVLITNLSVQPMRVTIPVVAASWLAQLGVILTNVLIILGLI